MGKVIVVAGPARAGKSHEQLKRYRQALATRPPGSALWLSPNWRSAEEVRAAILDDSLRACLTPQVLTFEQFAEAVVAAGTMPARPLPPLMKRQLIREILSGLHSKKELKHFAPIAATSGIVDLFTAAIRELKRLEIWPEHLEATCTAIGMNQKDREILKVYHMYQLALNQHRLYDAEGRFWLAREQLRTGQTRPFDRVRLLIVDGFTDFTHTEHEILESLAARVETTIITLPLEEPPVRAALFARSIATLQQLRNRHPSLAIEEILRSTTHVSPAMAHVEAYLFDNPRTLRTAPTTAGVEILAASGQLGEVELIAGTIKEILVSGQGKNQRLRPEDIVVVFRSIADVAPLLREAFRERGIPVAIEAGVPLAQIPVISAAVSFLRLVADDWPYRGLLAALGNSYFHPSWNECRDPVVPSAVEHTIRQLQVSRGSQQLLDAASWWAAFDWNHDLNSSDSEGKSQIRTRCERAATALPVLQRLKATLDRLPSSATCAAWAEALASLANDVGLLPQVAHKSDKPTVDRRAWDRLLAALKNYDRLSFWQNKKPMKLSLSELLNRISDITSLEQITPTLDETGCVRVLSAPSARGLRIPYLFLAGLSEKAFPSPDRGDQVFTKAESLRLSSQGLPFPAQEDRSHEEMLLFYDVLTRATERLYLSYPALDEAAQPLAPSPYLTEVIRTCGETTIDRQDVPDLSPVPLCTNPRSPTELRIRSMVDALEGDSAGLATMMSRPLLMRPSLNIVAGLQALSERGPGEEFGKFEGMLLSDSAKSVLTDRYGRNRCWSASQLEQYALCPYQFFASRVLRLEAPPELSLEVNYMVRGRILHDTLAALHRTINATMSAPTSLSSCDTEHLKHLYEQALSDLIGKLGSRNPIDLAFREIDQRLITQWSDLYVQQHQQYDNAWKDCEAPPCPAHFEVAFGSDRDQDSADPISKTDPFVIDHAGESILLSGRIDRIDVGRVGDTPVFNILDYKTSSAGRLSRQAIENGLALQLPLYAIVTQELLLAEQGAVPWRAGYWYVKAHGFKDKDAIAMYEQDGDDLRPSDDWQNLRTAVLDRVVSLVRGIRNAEFPVLSADDHCTGYCDYRTICRVGQARALEKTWRAPSPNPL